MNCFLLMNLQLISVLYCTMCYKSLHLYLIYLHAGRCQVSLT